MGGPFFAVDVTDFAGNREGPRRGLSALGGLHVILTTAGGGVAEKTFGKNGPHALETFRSTIDLNLIASFNISRLAAAHMADNEPEGEDTSGVIINTAHRRVRGPDRPGRLHRGQGRYRRHVPDHGPRPGLVGIRALAIAPSLFATGLTKGIPDEFAKRR